MPIGGAKAQGTVEIFFRQVGLRPLNAQVNRAFRDMSGRAAYYAGLIQTRMGMAFLGLSAAIAAFGVIAVKKFAEFDQAMMNTASVTGATVEQMKILRDVSEKLGTIGSASATDVANAMYFLGSAGYEVGQIFDAIEPIMKLSVATQSDMADTARITIQALNAFGKEAKDATHFAQVFAAGISSTQLQITWLGQALKHVGPVAREMNMDIIETVTVLGMLHDAGIQAGMAGRQLRRILQGTIKDTPQVTEVLKRLSLTTMDLSVSTLGFEQVMLNLGKAGASLGDVFKLFGLRASASGAVLKRQAQLFSEYRAKISDSTKLQAMFTIQMQGLEAQFKRLINVFQRFMRAAIEPFIPLVRKVVEALTVMFNVFAQFPQWVHVIMGLTTVFIAFGAALLGVALIMNGLLTQGMISVAQLAAIFTSSIKTAMVTVIRFSKVLTVNLINALLGTKYQFNHLSLAMINMKRMGIAKVFNRIGDSLVVLRTKLLALKATLFGEIVIGLAALYVITLSLIVAWKRWHDDIVHVFSTIELGLNTIRDNIKSFMSPVTDFFDTIKRGFDTTVEQLRSALGFDEFAKDLQRVKEKYEALAKTSKDFMKDAGSGMAKDLKEANDTLLDFFKNSKQFEQLKQLLDNMFKGPKEDLEEFGSKAMEIANLLDEKFTSWVDKVKQTWSDTIFDLIKGTKTWLDVWHMVLDDALKTFIDGFIEGMLNSWGKGLAKMVFDFHSAQAAIGGGTGINILKTLGSIASLFAGVPGGVPGSGVSGTGGVASSAGGGTQSFIQMHKGTDFVPRDMLAQLHKGEAIVPASQNLGSQEITIVNVVDPSFVQASIAREPGVIINVINDDVINAGPTRRTFRNYLR